jgi:hypothetical protein
VEESEAERAVRLDRENKKREEEIRQIPLQEIDESTWPRHVRQIAMPEVGGLGIDSSGRLYWRFLSLIVNIFLRDQNPL